MGVLNIQSNVTILQNDVTNLKNIPMIANQSAVRSSSKGTVNKTESYPANYSNANAYYDIPITPVANPAKCWLDHNIDITVSGYLRISNFSVNVYSTYIRVSYSVNNMASMSGSATIYGDYQVIEFY